MPRADNCVWNSISIPPGESSKVTVGFINAFVTFLCYYGERSVFFLLIDVQKASLLKGRKYSGEQTFTRKRLVSIKKELFAGQSGTTELQ